MTIERKSDGQTDKENTTQRRGITCHQAHFAIHFQVWHVYFILIVVFWSRRALSNERLTTNIFYESRLEKAVLRYILSYDQARSRYCAGCCASPRNPFGSVADRVAGSECIAMEQAKNRLKDLRGVLHACFVDDALKAIPNDVRPRNEDFDY